jgi:hypothetical protein
LGLIAAILTALGADVHACAAVSRSSFRRFLEGEIHFGNPLPVSPIVDGNVRIYYANAGKSFVIRSGPQFELLAVNDLGDGNHR